MNLQKRFSHIYIEKPILDAPLPKEILQKHPNSQIIPIHSYKEVFNRSKQNSHLQRKSQNLILAYKKENFLHPASYFIQNFGCENIFYVPHVFNCIYDCNYCFLQGMYPSSHIVLFVNIEDYFDAVTQMLTHYTKENPLYLCISYDTDLLAFEKLFGFVGKWIEYAHNKENLIIESRSKSANYRAISHHQVNPNFIHSWSILPELLIETHDFKTPSLSQRLGAIKKAMDDGWPIRLSIEPIIWIPEFEKIYGAFLEEVFEIIDADKIRDLNIDLFRINEGYLKKIRSIRSDSVLYFPYEKKGTIRSYSKTLADQLFDFFESALPHYIDMNKVYINKEYV
jgi:spore photoproduct lyase